MIELANSFVDKVTINVIAGKGGNGAVAFHREKYVANGGPDGGDGGRGGDIIIKVDPHMSTLLDFRYKRKYVAQNGADGTGRMCYGKDGESLVISVPRGTLVRDTESGGIMCDLSENDSTFVVAKGGRGGWGNAHFATPTRQAPRFAKSGLPGESRTITLELKLLADIGLVGFPNVGKSTLLSVVSAARPKIANYHFTTLSPNLGVVAVDDMSFVMADIPGLIEGAADGAGLGHAFLRHVDRCRLIIHVVDVSGSEGRDPIEDLDRINEELERYSPELATRPQIIAANKCDLLYEGDNLERLKKRAEELGCPLFEISAATHMGTKELMNTAAALLSTLPPIAYYEPDYVEPETVLGTADDLTIVYDEDEEAWFVEGEWLDRLVDNVNFSDYESRMFFDRMLRESLVFERMEAAGVNEGDIVSICGMTFEYKK